MSHKPCPPQPKMWHENNAFYMKTIRILLAVLLCCVSCEREHVGRSTARQNFDALWRIMDERYCFFEYKDIDWQEVYDRYVVQLSDTTDQYALFDLMSTMLSEVKDGHVNLTSPFDVSRYWGWYKDYPANFSGSIQQNYLGEDYRIAGGMRYQLLREGQVGYVYYGSFSSGVSLTNLSYIFHQFRDCKGLIIDVRNNGGGTLTYADRIASCFTKEKILTSYIQHKVGTAHDAFSDPYPIYLEPIEGLCWEKPVVVLTNRYCYSAANDFLCRMKLLPQVTLVGDRSGGGGGLPFSAELPIGWSIRFSASPTLDANKEQIEFGIDPDVRVDMLESDALKGKDSIIEAGIEILLKKNAE